MKAKDYDGDELWGIFLKEQGEVEMFRALHPMETMLSKNELTVSATVRPINQAIIPLNKWLAED